MPKAAEEKPAASRDVVKEVLREKLKIKNVDSIYIANAYRLPGGKDQQRPNLIFKLRSMFDKQIIWDHYINLNT